MSSHTTQNYGVNEAILLVDLSSKETEILNIPHKWRKEYLGGKGLVLRFLHDLIPSNTPPLSPENVLIIMTGPLTGTPAPASSKFAVITKSPLTGLVCTSICGGPFGLSLKRAGYDGIIIKGRAENPVIIIIDEENVKIEEAHRLWGLDTFKTQELLSEKGDSVVIGPAGENMVHFACIFSGHRVAGRGGMGAVMGSKKLKAVVTKGNKRMKLYDPKGLKKVLERTTKWIDRNFVTGKEGLFRLFGTPILVNINSQFNILPTKNFSKGEFKDAFNISGKMIKNRYYVKNTGCKGCRIRCGRYIKIGDKTVTSPEYESIALLGSNLGLSNFEHVSELNQLCNRLGLDTISTGNVLGFCMELNEKGFMESGIRFGEFRGLKDVILNIAHKNGQGKDMSLGVRALSEKYGGREFAMHVKGLELPGYDPRGCFGQGLGYATNGRGGCHLGDYIYGWERIIGLTDPHSIKEKPHLVVFAQNLFSAENSSIWCSFTTFAYLMEERLIRFAPRPILKFFIHNFPSLALRFTSIKTYPEILNHILGTSITQKEFLEIGERVFNLERGLNLKEGLSGNDDNLPERFFRANGSPEYMGIPLKEMLPHYYKLRRWNQDGIPESNLLKALNLEFLTPLL